MTSLSNDVIIPSGGDTGATLNLNKRLSIINAQIKIADAKVLDAGCGSGQYLFGLLEAGADAWGIEYFEERVHEFKRLYPIYVDRIACGNIESTSFPENFFDIVLLNEVLEHVPNVMKCLDEVKRVLKQDGCIIIFSPNRLYPFETHGVRLRFSGAKLPHAFPGIPYIPMKLGRKLFHYDARNFWPAQLRNLLKVSGFEIKHVGFVSQTFENISGHQPHIIKLAVPVLRRIFSVLNRFPGLRAFVSVSQYCVAIKN